jgi:hypothetical protein
MPGISYSADRSPFVEPIRIGAIYDYSKAAKNCEIIGIIRTKTDGKVILRLNDSETTSVYSLKDRILIKGNEEIHQFTLHAIKSKAIVLIGEDGKTYEVEAR